MLDAEVMYANSGTYLKVWGEDTDADILRVDQGVLLQREGCAACARGALLMARIRGFDGYEPEAKEHEEEVGTFVLDDYHTTEGLEGIFDELQLRLMEIAFEGWVSYHEVAGDMFKWNVPPADRLRAICANLIANGGEFVIPEVAP